MKKFYYLFALLIFAAIGLSSCTDDTQEMEQQISKLEQLLKTAQSDLETIKKQELSPLASAIKELNTKVAALEGKEPTTPADPTDLSSLSAALETLKEKVAALEGKEPSTPAEPTDLQTTIKTIEERLSKAESALKGIQQQPTPDGYDMQDLKETLDGILGDIETLKGKTPESTTPTDLSAISETLDLLKSRVAALEGKDPSTPISPTEPTDLSSIEASIRELDAKIKDLVTTAVLKEALKDMLTSDAIKDFVTTAVLREALKDKLTADDIKDLITNDKLDEALKDKLTNDDIKDLITNDKLKEALEEALADKLTADNLTDYVTTTALQKALEDALAGKLTANDIKDLVTNDKLKEALADRLTTADKTELETTIADLQKQLSIIAATNGHQYVDLGLPSGKLWATCNIGATSPEEYGNYYAWDATKTQTTYDQASAPYYDSQTSKYTKYIGTNGDKLTELEPSDDIAVQAWGGNWRISSKADFEELYNKDNCIWTWNDTKKRLRCKKQKERE